MIRAAGSVELATETPATAVPLWFGFAMAAAVLAAAVVDARYRVRRSESDGAAPRLLRIVLTAMLLAGATTFFLVVEKLFGPDEQAELVLMTLVAVALLMLIAMAVVAVLDFWLGLFGPCRTRKWLIIAIGAFALLFAAALGLSFWLAGAFGELLHPETLQVLALVVAAGITWWSRLPPAETGVERHFE